MVKPIKLKVRQVTIKDGIRLLMAFLGCWLIMIALPTIVNAISNMFSGII